MNVSIVLINYNGWKDTSDCLDSLNSLRVPQLCTCSIIVVDNASGKSIKYQVSSIREKTKLDIVLIENRVNLGFAGGNNIGIQYAIEHNAGYILLLNNDTIVSPDLITKLLSAFEKNPSAGIAGAKIYFAAGYEYHKGKYKKQELGKVIWYAGGNIDWNNMYATHRGVDEIDTGQYDKVTPTDFISGCCMMIKREVIETIGLLDEIFFMYLEDVDYCIRAKKAGFTLLFEPAAILWHKNAQSSGLAGSDLHVYYMTRNRLILGFRYAPFRTKLALIRESMRLLNTTTVQKQAVIDFYLHCYGERNKTN